MALIALAGTAVFLFLLVHPPRVDYEEEAAAWLDRHREEAERLSRRALARSSAGAVEIDTDLPCEEVVRVEDGVAFTVVPGGFKAARHGLCFSLSGTPPPLGFGEALPTVWKHLRGNWYFWTAE